MSEWRYIPGYSDYVASSDGQIARIDGEGDIRLLNPTRIRSGYFTVSLSNYGEKEQRLVHDLVYETFAGPFHSDEVINHIDGDKGNNSIYNLECISQSENVQASVDDRIEDGTYVNPASKLTEKDVVEIRRLYAQGLSTQEELARIYGVSQSVVSDVVNRITYDYVE